MNITPDATPPAPDPIGEATHAVWDALDLAALAASSDPEAPGVLEPADHPILVGDGTWGILAAWGTTPVRITVGHARPEEAAALGMDGNAPDPGYRPPNGRPPLNWDTRPLPRDDHLCVALDDGTYQQPDAAERREDALTVWEATRQDAEPPQLKELHQQLVIEDGEDPETVARSLIGPKGRATLLRVGVAVPGDMWPTAVYRGTRRELGTIADKANGSPIGRPPGGAR